MKFNWKTKLNGTKIISVFTSNKKKFWQSLIYLEIILSIHNSRTINVCTSSLECKHHDGLVRSPTCSNTRPGIWCGQCCTSLAMLNSCRLFDSWGHSKGRLHSVDRSLYNHQMIFKGYELILQKMQRTYSWASKSLGTI